MGIVMIVNTVRCKGASSEWSDSPRRGSVEKRAGSRCHDDDDDDGKTHSFSINDPTA